MKLIRENKINEEMNYKWPRKIGEFALDGQHKYLGINHIEYKIRARSFLEGKASIVIDTDDQPTNLEFTMYDTKFGEETYSVVELDLSDGTTIDKVVGALRYVSRQIDDIADVCRQFCSMIDSDQGLVASILNNDGDLSRSYGEFDKLIDRFSEIRRSIDKELIRNLK